MDLVIIVLRIVHIGSAVMWAGGAVLFTLFLEPTINALGPDGEKVIAELVERRRVPIFFAVTSTLTILAGWLLYWIDSSGLDPSWITSPSGLVFTTGGLFATAAWLLGPIAVTPAVGRVSAIGAEMKAAGGPPPVEMLARMHAAQERLHRIGLADLGLIAVAVLAMATARYLG